MVNKSTTVQMLDKLFKSPSLTERRLSSGIHKHDTTKIEAVRSLLRHGLVSRRKIFVYDISPMAKKLIQAWEDWDGFPEHKEDGLLSR